MKLWKGLEGGKSVHIGAELAQRLIEVVHLREDADHDGDAEDVRAGRRELVVAAEGELHGDTEALDGHDGDAADGTADAEVDHGVLLAVLGGDSVDHDHRKGRHYYAVEQKACVTLGQLTTCTLSSRDMRLVSSFISILWG